MDNRRRLTPARSDGATDEIGCGDECQTRANAPACDSVSGEIGIGRRQVAEPPAFDGWIDAHGTSPCTAVIVFTPLPAAARQPRTTRVNFLLESRVAFGRCG